MVDRDKSPSKSEGPIVSPRPDHRDDLLPGEKQSAPKTIELASTDSAPEVGSYDPASMTPRIVKTKDGHKILFGATKDTHKKSEINTENDVLTGHITEIDKDLGIGYFKDELTNKSRSFFLNIIDEEISINIKSGDFAVFTATIHGGYGSLKRLVCLNEEIFDENAVERLLLQRKDNDRELPGEDQTLELDDEREKELKRAFDALSQLPTGEVSRLADSAEKRKEKWTGEIPKSAPELYKDRPTSEGLPDFLRRVYGERGYLNGIMTTAHLDIIDPPAARAVRSWVEHHQEGLPTDIELPTAKTRPKMAKQKPA